MDKIIWRSKRIFVRLRTINPNWIKILAPTTPWGHQVSDPAQVLSRAHPSSDRAGLWLLDSSLKMTLLLHGDCCSCSDNIAANICGNIFLHLTTLKTFRKIRSWCSSLSYKHLLEVKSNVWFCLNYSVHSVMQDFTTMWFTPSRQRWWAVHWWSGARKGACEYIKDHNRDHEIKL